MSQVIVSFPNEFFRSEKSIDQKPSAGDLPGYPLRAAVAATGRVKLLGGHGLLLESADPAPVTDLQVLNAGEQQLEGTASQVVCDEQIRVNHGESVDEGLNHLALLLETLDILSLSQFLLEIERHRLPIQLPQKCESLELLLQLGGPVLAHICMDQTRYHSDLIGVLGGPASLEGEAYC